MKSNVNVLSMCESVPSNGELIPQSRRSPSRCLCVLERWGELLEAVRYKDIQRLSYVPYLDDVLSQTSLINLMHLEKVMRKVWA